MNYTLADFVLLKRDLKDQTKIKIVSGSMKPWIQVNEKIIVNSITPEEIKPFDIIVYFDIEAEILVCHIFIGLRDGKIICKPLARNAEDKPVDPNLLLAKVVKPSFRWYHRFLLKLFY